MEVFFLIALIAIAVWYLWTKSENKKRWIGELLASGFRIDESFELGDSALLFDTAKCQVAFVNWDALMNPYVVDSIPNEFKRYRTTRQAFPYADIQSVFVEKKNIGTHRTITIRVRNDFLRSDPEFAGYYVMMLAVVPGNALESMLPRLESIVHSELQKTIELKEASQ